MHILVLFLNIILSAVSYAQEVNIALKSEPPNLDSTQTTDHVSNTILGHTMEGLVRQSAKAQIIPGVATTWKLNNTSAIFHLRKNAKWHDGKPVTSDDFVFAWQKAVNPKTASRYSFIFFPIKNAEAISKGKKPVSSLGVKAQGPHKLEVTLERPCAYFVQLTSFFSYYPQRKDLATKWGRKYGADADKLAFNGAFKLTKWIHGASLKMEKNPFYWNSSKVKLKAINVPYLTPDQLVHFNLLKDGKIDFVGLTKDTLINAQKEKIKVKRFSTGYYFFLEFNFRPNHVTSNKNLRLAIKELVNYKEYLKRVVALPGTKAGRGLVPSMIAGTKKTFRREFPLKKSRASLAKAKKYIAQFKKENPGKTTIHWLTRETMVANREAEYFQGLVKKHLGMDVKIDRQIFKQFLAKMSQGKFDIASASWGPDYNDPMTYIDLFASWNPNNRGRWINKKYDSLVQKALDLSGGKKRMKYMAEAEKILLEDIAILPLYEQASLYATNKKLKGLVRRMNAPDPDFTFARIK